MTATLWWWVGFRLLSAILCQYLGSGTGNALNLASFTRLFLGKEGLLLTVHACAKLLDIFPVNFL